MADEAEGEAPPKAPRSVRKSVPTIMQMEAVECGAACLAMVLASFGRWEPLESVRHACGVTRDGTKASNIVKAANNYGLLAKGLKREPETLAELPLPQVLFWNFNHFVVAEGYDRDKVYLNDPAFGPRTVSQAEFNEAFTGVVLAFEPGEAFEKAGSRPSIIASLIRRMKGSYDGFFMIVLLSFALILPSILVASFARVFVDFYLVQQYDTWLMPLLLGMLGTAVVRTGLTGMQKHFLLKMQSKLALATSARFLWHVLRLPMRFFAQRYAGEIGSRLQMNDKVAGAISGPLATTTLSVLSMLIYAAVMLQYDWLLTLVAIAFAGVNLLALRVVTRRLQDASKRLLIDQGKLQAVSMQSLAMVETFKASGTEHLVFRRWAGAHAKVINAEQTMGRTRRVLEAIPVLLGAITTVAILVVGGFRVMDGAMTLGMLVAFQALMAMFNAPMVQLVLLGGQMQETAGSLVRVDDVLQAEIDPEFQRDPQITPERTRLSGRLVLDKVSFGYSPIDKPLIRKLSLSLEPGMRVALVGGSGSGKSTVGKLIAQLYDVTEGEIRLDGHPLPHLPREVVRSNIILVEQEPMVMEGTIRDNILLWDETISETRMTEAARDAMIHDDIADRPEGYYNKIKEGGRNLSGGQRQRLALARALARDPSVLILDEATSALDASSEVQILDNLRKRGCTCIIISHRLSAIRDCDEILYLERGRIVQRGRHEDLMAQSGFYKSQIES